MKILKEMLDIIIGLMQVIIIPTVLLGGISYWIEQCFGLNSIQGYLWFALVWWLSLNFIKK